MVTVQPFIDDNILLDEDLSNDYEPDEAGNPSSPIPLNSLNHLRDQRLRIISWDETP